MQTGQQSPAHLWFLSGLVRIRVPHEEGTDGISVIEHRAPFAESPPLHIHLREDELFCILDGELRFVVDGEERRSGPGEMVLTRKGVPHTYRVESAEGGRWLVITTHGDFERFVRELSRPAAAPELPKASGPPSPDELQALGEAAQRHHIRLVGPPLA